MVKTQLETLSLVGNEGRCGLFEVSSAFKIGHSGALRRLRRLRDSGHLEERTPWMFNLTDKGREVLDGDE